MKERPGGLTAICIIAIVLGCLGMLTCLSTIGGMAMQSNMEAFMPPGNGNGANDAALEMQTKIAAAQLRWRPVQIVVVVFHAVIIVALLIGGIMTIKLNPLGRKILMYSFLVAIPFDLGRLIPTIGMQLEMIPIMQDMMKSMPQGKGNGAAQGADAMVAIMTASMIAGIAIACGWCLVKLILYIWSALYLRKPEIVELCTPNDPFANDPYSAPGMGR